MMGVKPTFGDVNRFAGITTPIIYTNTETGERWDINGNPLIIPEKDKGVPFEGVVSTIGQPYPGWHGSTIEEHG